MRINIKILYSSLFTFSVLLGCDALDSPEAKKPNVMVIFADDVGTGDVPGYWNSERVNMPHLKNLVAEGVTFTDAHSSPLCAPSRYMFLSGNYQHRGVRYPSIWNLNYKYNQFKPDQMSIAELLKNNGYDTAMFGKWHLGGKVPTEEGFQTSKFYAKRDTVLSEEGHDWSKPMEEGPWEIGFETSYITTGGIQSPPYMFVRNNTLDLRSGEIKYWNEGNYSMPRGLSVIKASGEGSYEWDSTAYNMILVNETKAFLDNHISRESNPFFTYIALGAVHLPNTPPYRFDDGSPVADEFGTPHMDVLYEMDKVVGALVEALDDRDLLEDTIVIFTSDNGGLSNETHSDEYGHLSNGPLRGAKGDLYEGGIRVPMTFRWDNGPIPKGETRSNLIGLNDLYRTICNLVGVEVPNNQAIDSMNFAKYVLDAKKDAGLRKWYGAWMYDSSRLIREVMRFNEMKLVRSFQNDTYELFNLTDDVSESKDISRENDDIVQKLFRKLRFEGPCYDRGGLFKVKTKGKKRTFAYKSCFWFRQKRTAKRCGKFPEARQYCRSTCAGRNSQYCAKDLHSEQKLFKIFSNTY